MFSEFLDSHKLNVLPRDARKPFPLRADRQSWLGLNGHVRSELISWGTEAKAGYPPLTATQFMAYVRTGDRQAYEQPYFERRRRLMGAALAECVADDGCYMDAVIDGLWCICEETSWVISAHNGSSHTGMRPPCERPLPDTDNPYIDLFAAQTSATLSYTLYLLEDKLNAVSPLIARRVRREIEKRVFHPFMTRDDFWWMGIIRRDVNNWTPWILSNVIDSMLILERDDTRLCEGLKRAMRMLDSYIAVLPSDGGCDEGCGYWNVAGASLMDCLESLYAVTGGQVDFFEEPLIRAIGDFPLKAHISGDYYWNFADCDAKPVIDGECMLRYGELTGNAPLMALGAETLSRRSSVKPADTPQMNRVLKALFCKKQTIVTVEPPRDVALPQLGVFAYRRGGWYLAAKAGNNGESHNHNDLGSFIIYYDGQPQVIDAGNMTYTAKTFSAERYTLWNTRSRSHSVPLIGDIEQREGAGYIASVIERRKNGVSMDLSAAYPSEAGISAYLRVFAIADIGVTITDELTLIRPLPVAWVFMLRSKPEIADDGLSSGRVKLVYSSELTPNVEELPITDARMARSYPGSLWRVTLTEPAAIKHSQRFNFIRS